MSYILLGLLVSISKLSYEVMCDTLQATRVRVIAKKLQRLAIPRIRSGHVNHPKYVGGTELEVLINGLNKVTTDLEDNFTVTSSRRPAAISGPSAMFAMTC